MRSTAFRTLRPSQLLARKAAFTLVEVLIAMSVMAVLLGIVWRSVDTYRTLQEKADARTTRLKVERGINAQLRDDLLATQLTGAPQVEFVVASSPAPDTHPFPTTTVIEPTQPTTDQLPSGTTSSPYGLRGGSTWLVLDLCIPTIPLDTGSSSEPSEAGVSTDANNATTMSHKPIQGSSQSSEPFVDNMQRNARSTVASDTFAPTTHPPYRWQRIAYYFVATHETLLPPPGLVVGLTRITVEPAYDFRLDTFIESVATLGDPSSTTTTDQSSEQGDSSDVSQLPTDATALDPTIPMVVDTRMSWLRSHSSLAATDELPEIAYCRFRYYDGQGWQDEWDSRKRKSLPATIAFSYVLQTDLEFASKRDSNDSPMSQLSDARQTESTATTAITDPIGDLTIMLPSVRSDAATEEDSPASFHRQTLVEVPVRQSLFTVMGSVAPESDTQQNAESSLPFDRDFGNDRLRAREEP